MKDAARFKDYPSIRLGAISASLTVFAVFLWAVLPNDFVALDDYAYIVYNRSLSSPNWKGFPDLFTSFTEGNWHPVTMISLLLDRLVWGFNPSGYHLTNVVLHSVSVFIIAHLFFDILRLEQYFSKCSHRHLPQQNDPYLVMTSVAAALFFGLHPLRVESVVWASERKDTLFMLFLLLGLRSYLRYASTISSCSTARRGFSYIAAVSMAALSVMSKAAAVPIPFILLLLDWYPLRRMHDMKSFYRSCIEKLPFLLLSLICLGLNYKSHLLAMGKIPDVTLASRLLVACRAILFYAFKSVYPSGLSAFYPHPGDVIHSPTVAYYLFASGVVILIFFIAVYYSRTKPQWLAAWLFYLISLFPVLGFIQVGEQWAADRYSYLPSVAVSLVWGSGAIWLFKALNARRAPFARGWLVIASGMLCLYTLVAVRQVTFWRDTETLASRIIEMSPRKLSDPYHARAVYRYNKGEYPQALEDNTEAIAVALREGRTGAYASLGHAQARILVALGRDKDALAAAEWALRNDRGSLPADFPAFYQALSQIDKP